MPKSCNGAGSYYIALSSSFQLPVRRQQSCTAIQLDDRLYTELDRPLGIRSVCVCVMSCWWLQRQYAHLRARPMLAPV